MSSPEAFSSPGKDSVPRGSMDTVSMKTPKVGATAKAQAKTGAMAKAKAQAKGKAKAKALVKAQAKGRAKAGATSKAKAQPKGKAKAKPQAKGKARAKPQAKRRAQAAASASFRPRPMPKRRPARSGWMPQEEEMALRHEYADYVDYNRSYGARIDSWPKLLGESRLPCHCLSFITLPVTLSFFV
jgi:hypothetical protein